MATLYLTNGEVKEVKPANGKDFTLTEMQKMVGGYIEHVPLPSGNFLIVNDEGKSHPGTCMSKTPKNHNATELFKKEYPIGEFPNNNDQLICGDAILLSDTEFK